MKFQVVLILLLMTLGHSLMAQDVPKKIRKRIVQYNSDSTHVLIQKGKKSGLYNIITKQFDIKLNKSPIFLYHYTDAVVFFQDKKVVQYGCYNGKFNYYCNSDDDSTMCIFYKRLNDNDFALTLFEYPSKKVGNEYGYDNVHEIKKNRQFSGVYSLEKKKWLIPNKYMKIYAEDDYIFAIKGDSVYLSEKYGEIFAFSYDVYDYQDGECNLVYSAPSTELNHLQGLYNWESVDSIDKGYYLVKKDGKYGIIYENLDGYSLHYGFHLAFKFVLPCVYDMIVPGPGHVVMTYNRDAENQMALYDKISTEEMNPVQTGNEAIYYTEDEKFNPSNMAFMKGDSLDVDERIFNDNVGLYGQFGMSKINDSLFKLVNIYPGDLYALLDSYEFDSIDANGNVVYDRSNVEQSTGIFNINTQDWLLPPNYWNCYFAGEKIIVHEKLFSEEDHSRLRDNCAILDLKLINHESGIELYKFRSDPKYVQQLFHENQYTKIERLDKPDTDGLGWSGNPVYQCWKQNGKMDLISPGQNNFDPYMLAENVDFAIADPNSYSTVYLNNDSIYINIAGSVYGVSKKGKIQFVLEKKRSDNSYQLSLFDHGEVKHIKDQLVKRNRFDPYKVSISMEMINEKLVVQYYPIIYTELIDENYGEYYGLKKDEFEYSAIYEKSERGYVPASAFYATLNAHSGGYIVTTAEKGGKLEYDELGNGMFDGNGYPLMQNSKEARYILLDSNLAAISLLDHYDFDSITDLGFGLKVCTDKGCMFVTYESEALTSDDWDDFTMSNGKISAIKNPTYDFDEFGDEILIADGSVQIIELPKK